MRLILFTIFSVVLLFSPVSLKSQVNDQLLRRANEAYETQKWKSAGTLFDLYLADSIVYSQSFKKAIISNLMAHDEMSIKKAAAMLDKYNDQTEAILKDLSKEFIRLKLLDEYEISVYRLINVRPESEKMLYNNLINYRLFLRQTDHVVRIIQEAQNKGLYDNQWNYILAESFSMNGDTENAIEVYKEVLKNSPQDFNANLFMGNYYYILGKNQIDTLNINYKKKNSPSIHDYAEYRDRLNILYRTYYEPAIRYLEIASVNNENKVIKNTLNEMFDLRDEFNTNGKKRRKK